MWVCQIHPRWKKQNRGGRIRTGDLLTPSQSNTLPTDWDSMICSARSPESVDPSVLDAASAAVFVADAWPELPAAVRKAILTLASLAAAEEAGETP